MDLRKYSVSEFSEMLENEMKLNKEKCEKIAKYYEMKRDIKNDLEITYKIVAPVKKMYIIADHWKWPTIMKALFGA